MFATLSTKKPRLIFDKIGVVAVPNYTNPDHNRALSAREKRKVRNFLNTQFFIVSLKLHSTE